MPEFCAAYGCSNRRCVDLKQHGITFHVFPKDGERRAQWIVALGRENLVVSDRTRICSEHFRAEDFDRTGQTVRLKAGVVPTIFSFPAHLQRKSGATGERRKRHATDHTYGLPVCYKAIKAKLDAASARVMQSEREKFKAVMRERRAKKNMQDLLEALKEKNLISDELERYSGQPAYKVMESDSDWAPSLLSGHTSSDTSRAARQIPQQWSWKETQAEKKEVNQDAAVREPQTRGCTPELDVKQSPGIKEEENWSPQEDQKPPQIKEEQEENEVTAFIFNPDSVKVEDEEEEPQLSELHHSQTEEIRASWGSKPDESLESDVEDENVGSSSEVDVRDGSCVDGGVAESGLGSGTITRVLVGETGFSPGHVKSEDDELHHSQTAGNRDSVEADPDDSDPETEVSDVDWEDSSEAPSGVDSGANKESSGRYSCSECGKTFTRRQYLLEHHRIHTGVKPFNCSVCSKAFRWRNGLVRHMKSHSGEKPFSCSDCSKAFSSKKNLMEHRRIHSDERPYSCSVCGASYKRAHTLKDHMRTHTGERPHKCSICGSSFRYRSYSVVHERGHAGEKPFSCPTCKAAFKRKLTLEEHIRTHTGEKPYSCSVCGKSYVRYISSSRHMRCHTGERPYSCSTCQAMFRWRHAFVAHTKIHSGGITS